MVLLRLLYEFLRLKEFWFEDFQGDVLDEVRTGIDAQENKKCKERDVVEDLKGEKLLNEFYYHDLNW